MRRRNWPIALAVLFVAQLVWYLFYTGSIVRSFRSNAEDLSEVYSQVQEGLVDPSPDAAGEALIRLQGIILESGVPLILTGVGDTILAAVNLPFEADLTIPSGQARVRDYASRLDLQHPPLGDPTLTLIHFGDPPEVRNLRWIPWLQAGGLLLTAFLGVLLIQIQRRAEGEKAWTAMARELAHQLGTPLSALQGWLEIMKLPGHERPEGLGIGEIAEEIGADLDRLERITHRFELIGMEPELQDVELDEILEALRRYLDLRLPRRAAGVALELEVEKGLPSLAGNDVLLTWALENVVKNALDALGGRGGTIRIWAGKGEKGMVHVSVKDSGPGVPPELRREIFKAGVTSKAQGWGVGLALSRRIVEGVHRGRIELGKMTEPGRPSISTSPPPPPRGGRVSGSNSSESPEGPHLRGLNPQQRRAVEHFQGPLLVLAGAGSGKTRVLTSRICHLIRHHGVASHRILAVTFTNKAAGEMRDRVHGHLGEEPRGMWLGTFHSLGARILRRHAPRLGWSSTFTIYDQDQSLRQIKQAQQELGIDPKRWNPKVFRAHISGAKNQLVSAGELIEETEGSFDIMARNVAKVYPVYQEALRNHEAMDFDDLLMKPVELLREFPEVLEDYRERFSFLLVDEYQDTNRAQYKFLELLAEGSENLMVVGDDDQSIYGWRGADIRNILEFEKGFPGANLIRLEQNYRSTGTILQAANEVIQQNVNRKGKTLRTDRIGGDKITVTETLDETDEARWIVNEITARLAGEPDRSFRSFAILYRTNAQARAMEDAFRRKGAPYQVVGGVRFYERREIQDVLAYLRLISNPRDGGAFDRVVNYPRRGVGPTSVARLREWARAHECSLLETAARAAELPNLPAKAEKSLIGFSQLIQRYSARAAQVGVGTVLEELVEELELLDRLREEGPDGDDRAENVKELIAGALDFDAELLEEEDLPRDRFTELDLFLQRVALVAEVDLHDREADTVTLMTLHNAKGLEFPVVFIAGLEDGLFPLGRAYDDPEALEEERRLFYVGVTRAEDKLYLTHARQRRRAGEYTVGRLSPFAEAIGEELVEERPSPQVKKSYQTGFGGDFGSGLGGIRRRRRTRDDFPDDAPAGGDEYNQDLPRFVKGERVAHGTFGSGTVLEVSGFGPDVKVTVNFDSVGRKKLLARYADLEKDYF